MTFFVVSVVATTLTLLGAALLYAATGSLHLERLGVILADRSELLDLPLTTVAVALVLAGLAFKVAAVPFHAWAPATYDGALLPVAAYLSTASKLGGVVALLAVVQHALPPSVAGPVLALVAALTMTVGNLVALRQRRTVRLLAWSSVAQAGYILAPSVPWPWPMSRPAPPRTPPPWRTPSSSCCWSWPPSPGWWPCARPGRTAGSWTTCAGRPGGIPGLVRAWPSP